MAVVEFISVVMAAFVGFWIFVWLGDLMAKTPKLFFYGKFRKFFD